jgi:hypothetical protein
VTEKKEMTAADLKQARKGDTEAPAKGKTYGFLCISLLFRPLPASTVPRGHVFRASVGNEDDDALLSCYGVATTTTNMSNTHTKQGGLGGTTTLGVSSHHHQQQQQVPPISGRTQHTAAAHLSRTGGDKEKEKEKEKESYFSRFFSRPQHQQQQPRTSRNSVEGEQEEKYWQTKKGR